MLYPLGFVEIKNSFIRMYLKTDLYKRSHLTFLLSVEEKVQKKFYSFTCILPDIVAHKITQNF